MRVYLTFDVEVWCNGWLNLDQEFEPAFDRYIYGRSPAGDWGLPKTVEILNRHGLTGIFFVETLFAARFGHVWLERIVDLLRGSGQDVQLHLHTEWVDEIRELVIADQSQKRQHLFQYSLSEQRDLIAFGLSQLARCGVRATAFRAGSYAANGDTLRGLRDNGIYVDTSLNRCFVYSGTGTDFPAHPCQSFLRDGVQEYPVYVFRDAFGRSRPAQLAAAGLAELQDALAAAEKSGHQHFVIVSHSFEMLKARRADPDPVMIRRFEGLCRYLAENSGRYQVGPFVIGESKEFAFQACTGLGPTITRYVEQASRRIHA